MKEQSKTWIWVVVVALVVLIGGTFYLSQRDKNQNEDNNQNQQGDVLPADAMFITAKHQFTNGTHIVAGEVEVPTPCHSLSVEFVVRESFPEQVTLNFSSTSEAEICAQVISSRRFKVEFQASEGAQIGATWNGEEAILNLIPVGEDEDLTNFDIYIKG